MNSHAERGNDHYSLHAVSGTGFSREAFDLMIIDHHVVRHAIPARRSAVL